MGIPVIKPGIKPEYTPPKDTSWSAASKIELGSTLLSSTQGWLNSRLGANSLRTQADTYALNATLGNVDAVEAIRIGQENAQIVNLERYKTKGKQLASFAGSGFAVSSGSFGEIVAETESEYKRTMAAIHYEAEGARNAKLFESKMNTIQSNYLRKMAKNRSKYANINFAISAVTAVASASAKNSAAPKGNPKLAVKPATKPVRT